MQVSLNALVIGFGFLAGLSFGVLLARRRQTQDRPVATCITGILLGAILFLTGAAFEAHTDHFKVQLEVERVRAEVDRLAAECTGAAPR